MYFRFSNTVNGELIGHQGSGSGGYAENIFKYAAKELYGICVEKVEFRPQRFAPVMVLPTSLECLHDGHYFLCRNPDLLEAVLVSDGEILLHFAIANGFRNIQNLVQKIKRKKCSYHYVEVMACPSGKRMLLIFL